MDIRLLGPIEVSLDSERAPLGPKQQRAVLAMLALELNRTVSTDRLIEGLWSQRAPPSAPKLVQLYVSQLRRLLGAEAEIVTRGRGYELRLAAERVDAGRFERLVAEAGDADGSAARLAREALALWRGAALADVADEPFAAVEIRRLEELRLRATELAIEGELAAGRHRELIGELEALAAAHPLSERLHAQRMLALYRSGRQAEALEAFRQARRRLVDEIGVEPGPELRRLHDAILRQDAAALDPPMVVPSVAVDGRAPPVAARAPGSRMLAAAAALALLGGLAIFAVSRGSGPDRLARIDENQVGLIDPASAKITAQYPVGRAPSALAAGGGSVWVANKGDGTISRIEPGRTPIVTIPVGPDPGDLAFAAGSLWATDGGGVVSQISPAANRVVRRIAAGNAPRAIAAGFGALWVASAADRAVTWIDLRHGARPERIDLGARPTALAAGNGAVWVTSEEANSVFRIEPRSRTVVKTIGVGNGAAGVAVAGGAVWIVNRQDATISRIDAATDTVTDLVDVGRDPSAIAAGEHGVWVASPTGGTVSRIDPLTRRMAETISVGGTPSALAVADGSVWTAALAAPATHRGGTLRVEAGPFGSGQLEAGSYGDATAYELLSLAYDGLVAYRRAGGATFGTLVGDLATDVPRPSPDGRTYVFTLRPGLRYSDGSPVRPVDFRASLEHLVRDDRGGLLPPFYQDIVGAQRCARRPGRCDLSAGIVTDARLRTITVHLTRPDGEFLQRLAYPLALVAPAAHPFGGRTQAPGTGPYMIAGYGQNRGARLVRNPYFRAWSPDARPDGLPDEIVVRVDPGSDARIAAMQRGRADIALAVGAFGGRVPPGLRAFAAGDAGQLYTAAVPELDFAFLNVRTTPFDDPRVRRAINYAVDRRVIASLAGGPDLAQPACRLLPPAFPDYSPSCPYTQHPIPGGGWTAPDIHRARRLIARSGTTGARVTVWINRDKRAMARYLVSLLHELGYRSSLRVFSDFTSYRAAMAHSRTPPQIGIDGWYADTAVPSDFTPPFRCAGIHSRSVNNTNLARFCDRSLEARIAEAQAEPEPRADALWRQVYRDLDAAAPAVPLVNRRTLVLVSKRVGNYQPHPLWTTLLEQLWVH